MSAHDHAAVAEAEAAEPRSAAGAGAGAGALEESTGTHSVSGAGGSSFLSAPDAHLPVFANGSGSGSGPGSLDSSSQGSIRRLDAVAMLRRAASQREMMKQQQQQQQHQQQAEAAAAIHDAGIQASASSLAGASASASPERSFAHLPLQQHLPLDPMQQQQILAHVQPLSLGLTQDPTSLSGVASPLGAGSSAGAGPDANALAALQLQMQMQQYLQTQQQIQQLQASLLAQGVPQHLVGPISPAPPSGTGGMLRLNESIAEEEEVEDEEGGEDELDQDDEDVGPYPRSRVVEGLEEEADDYALPAIASGSALASAFSPGFLSPALAPHPALLSSPGAAAAAAAAPSLLTPDGLLRTSPGFPSPAYSNLSVPSPSALDPFSLQPLSGGQASSSGVSPTSSGTQHIPQHAYLTQPPILLQPPPLGRGLSGNTLSPALSPLEAHSAASSLSHSHSHSHSNAHSQAAQVEARRPSPLPSLEQLRARILHERQAQSLRRSASTSSAAHAAARAYALEKLMGVGAGYSQRRALSPTDELEMGRNRERRRTMLGRDSSDEEEEEEQQGDEGESEGEEQAGTSAQEGEEGEGERDARNPRRANSDEATAADVTSSSARSSKSPVRARASIDSGRRMSKSSRYSKRSSKRSVRRESKPMPPLPVSEDDGEALHQHMMRFGSSSQAGGGGEDDGGAEAEEDLEDEDARGDELRWEKRASRVPLTRIQTKLPPLPSPTEPHSATFLRSPFSSDGGIPTPTTPTYVPMRKSSSNSGTGAGNGGAGGSVNGGPLTSSPGSANGRLRPHLRRSKTIGGLSAMAEQRRKLAFVADLMKPLGGESGSAGGRQTQQPPAPSAQQADSGEGSQLQRAGSQREAARAQLLRKLSGRRTNAPPQLTQAVESSGAAATSPPRLTNLIVPASGSTDFSRSLLTPPQSSYDMQRTGSFDSVGDVSTGAPSTGGLSPGFVAARNRASAIAIANGEDNFMFESGGSDVFDDDDGDVSGDLSRRVHIQDTRRKSAIIKSSSRLSVDDFDDSTEDDDADDGDGHDDFLQMHEELQEEEGQSDEDDADETGVVSHAIRMVPQTAEAQVTEVTATPKQVYTPHASTPTNGRVLSDEMGTPNGAESNGPDSEARLRFYQFGSPAPSNADVNASPGGTEGVSVPLALNLSGSPLGKSGRGDWPQSMSSIALRSSVVEELAAYRDGTDEEAKAFPGECFETIRS